MKRNNRDMMKNNIPFQSKTAILQIPTANNIIPK